MSDITSFPIETKLVDLSSIKSLEGYGPEYKDLTDFIAAANIGYSDADILVDTGDIIRIAETGDTLAVLPEGSTSIIAGSPVPVEFTYPQQQACVVANFGGDRTGATSSTAALQAAIDEAVRAGHKTVVLPSGRWLSGEIEGPHGQFNLVCMSSPKNQNQSDQIATIVAEVEGQNTLVPSSTESYDTINNWFIKGVNFEGASENDTRTNHIYFDPDLYPTGYDITCEDVGFIYGGWGVGGAENFFKMRMVHTHGWLMGHGIGRVNGVSSELINVRGGRMRTYTPANITSMTQADPCVVTLDATLASLNIQDGDMVWIEGITTGNADLTDRMFIASAVSGNSITLKNLDNSAGTAWSAGGTLRRSSCNYWLSSQHTQVKNFDTSSENSGIGSVQIIVGKSPTLNQTDDGYNTSHTTFFAPHFEGAKGAFVYVAAGSHLAMYNPHFMNGTPDLPQAIFAEYMDAIWPINSPRFKKKITSVAAGGDGVTEGSYRNHVRSLSNNSQAYLYWLKDEPNETLTVDGLPNSRLIDVFDNIQSVSTITSDLTAAEARIDNLEDSDRMRAKMSSTLTVPSGNPATKIPLTSSLENVGGILNTSTGTTTIQVDGVYSTSGTIEFASAVAGASMQVRMYVDGSEVDRRYVRAFDTGTVSVTVDFTETLVENQVVEFYAFHNSGTSLTLNSGDRTRISLYRTVAT